MIPPAILDMRIPRSDGRPLHLWLPLFLLWPLLWLVWLLLLVPAAMVDLVLLLVGRDYHHYSLLLVRTYQLLCETRGLVVTVKDDDTDVHMAFI